MANSKLSVILVSYRSSGKIVPLVSRLAKIKTIFQIVIIDNYSQDSEVATLKNLRSAISKVDLILNPENRGFAAAVNQGIHLVLKKGTDRTLLLNPDIKITAKDILALSQNPTDIVAPVLRFKRGDKTVYDFGGKIFWPLCRPYHLESTSLKSPSLSPDYLSGACLLIKNDVFRKNGFFDSLFFLYFEDVDFFLRVKENAIPFTIDQNTIVDHAITEHRFSHDDQKLTFLLVSQKRFIDKWCPHLFQPTSYIYWLLLKLYIKLKN